MNMTKRSVKQKQPTKYMKNEPKHLWNSSIQGVTIFSPRMHPVLTVCHWQLV